MSKHKGLAAIGKKSQFSNEQFVWKVFLPAVEYTKTIPK